MGIKELKKELIKEILLSKNIFLSAHKNIDLDAFSSMAGMSLITKKLLKKSYIIIDNNQIESSTKDALDMVAQDLNIITASEAKKLINSKSLLIVLDVNKPSRIEAESVLNDFNKVIVIDHHSKTKETLEKGYTYIDEKATSTSEIVTNLLSEFKVKITKPFANILLGGIALDTNNFMYKMNRKAFYYCYYLTSKGASVTEAQGLLKQDLKEYIDRSKMLANTKVDNDIAIATGQKGKIYKGTDLAKMADLLMEFKGIKVTFAIGHVDKDTIGISARSIDKVNVGKIMETFGGGGSKTEAAAQVKDMSIVKITEEIEKLLKR